MLCGLFGKTRQAYHEALKANARREARHQLETETVVRMVQQIRKQLPRVGSEKLWHMVQRDLCKAGLRIGRDRFCTLLRASGLMLYPMIAYKPKTTDSKHWMRVYPNLIAELIIDRPDQLYVSDITYVLLQPHFCYVSLVTDAYSHKVVGCAIEQNLTADGPVRALEQALRQRKPQADGTYLPLIHHSDRGSQYCSRRHTDLLKAHGVQISMTENGSPYENAIAERINGILKYEFGIIEGFASYEEAVKSIRQAVKFYNELRPHLSCNYLTPNQAHKQRGKLLRRWKNKVYPKTQQTT